MLCGSDLFQRREFAWDIASECEDSKFRPLDEIREAANFYCFCFVPMQLGWSTAGLKKLLNSH